MIYLQVIFQPNQDELDAYSKQHAKVVTAMGVYFTAHNTYIRTRNRGCLAQVHLTKNRYRSQIVRLLRCNIHPIFGDLPIIPKDQRELARRRALLAEAGRDYPSSRLKQIWSSIKTHIGCDRVLVFSPFKEPQMVLAAYLRSQGARVWTYFGGMQSNPQTLQEFRSLPLSSPKDGVPK